MSTTERPNLRDLLERMSDGDDAAREEVYEHLYGVLRHRAQIYMSGQPPGHTLQPTALIHEAFLRMDRARGSWSSEACFLAVAAKAMRDALVDHARTKSRRKRKAQGARQPLEMTLVSYEENAVDILDLDERLNELAAMDEQSSRAARAIELRFFGGLDPADIATVLGTSQRTVERDLRSAKAWLHRALA